MNKHAGQTLEKCSVKMCKHKNIVFLGKQEIPETNEYLALFNCQDCHSTITLKLKKKRRKSIKKIGEK